MTDEIDRRVDERTECDIEAKVELSDHLAIACRVKDLSATGVKMQISETLHLSAEFDLLIPIIESTFQRYRVKTIWRKDDILGGEFITPIAQ